MGNLTLTTYADRRWLRRVLYSLVAFNMLLAGAALGIRSQDSAEPFTAAAALDAFRAASTEASVPATAPTAAATSPETDAAVDTPATDTPASGDVAGAPASPAPAAPQQPATATPAAPRATPAPPSETAPGSAPAPGEQAAASTPVRFPADGVYVYDTKGHEEVDALGGARHDYPAETTMTWRTAGCGVQAIWQPLEDRVDTQQYCPEPGRHRIAWVEAKQAFFGQSQTTRMECEHAATAFRVDARPGDTDEFSCTDGHTTAENTVEILEVGPYNVAGEPVEAVHARIVSSATGANTADVVQEAWFRQTDGLVLWMASTTKGSAPGPGGKVTYFEGYTIELQSVEPLR